MASFFDERFRTREEVLYRKAWHNRDKPVRLGESLGPSKTCLPHSKGVPKGTRARVTAYSWLSL